MRGEVRVAGVDVTQQSQYAAEPLLVERLQTLVEEVADASQCLLEALVRLGKAKPEMLLITWAEGVTRGHADIFLCEKAFAELQARA